MNGAVKILSTILQVCLAFICANKQEDKNIHVCSSQLEKRWSLQKNNIHG